MKRFTMGMLFLVLVISPLTAFCETGSVVPFPQAVKCVPHAVFEKAVGFDSRFRLLGQIHNLMLVNGFSRRDIDDIRRLVSPERRAILAI